MTKKTNISLFVPQFHSSLPETLGFMLLQSGTTVVQTSPITCYCHP